MLTTWRNTKIEPPHCRRPAIVVLALWPSWSSCPKGQRDALESCATLWWKRNSGSDDLAAPCEFPPQRWSKWSPNSPSPCKKLLEQFQNVSSFPGDLGLNHSWPWLITMLCTYIQTANYAFVFRSLSWDFTTSVSNELAFEVQGDSGRLHLVLVDNLQIQRRNSMWCKSWMKNDYERLKDLNDYDYKFQTVLCVQTNHTQARSDSDYA